MNEEEIAKLKLELKKEILNELTRKDYVKDNAWKKIKEEFTRMFHSKGYKKTSDLYQIFAGMQTVIRFSMGYRSVTDIPAEEYEEARKRMFTMFNMFPKKEDKKN